MLTNVPISTHGHSLAGRQWQELKVTLTASHLPPNTQYLKLTWCAHHWTSGLFVQCHCDRVCSDQHLPVLSGLVTILLCHHALPPTCKGIRAGNSPVVLWPLSYFRWDSALKVYPSFYKWHSLLFVKAEQNSKVWLCCFLGLPPTSGRGFSLYLGCCEQCFSEQGAQKSCRIIWELWLWYSQETQYHYHDGRLGLHSHQYCAEIFLSLCPYFLWKYYYISIADTLTRKARLAMVLLIFSHWLLISLFPYTCWPFACILLRNVLSPVFKIWLVGDGWLPDLLLFRQIYTNQNRIDLTWRQICKTLE